MNWRTPLAGIARSSFVRRAATLGGGTLAAQVVTLLAAPLITRLFPPDEMGAMGLFVSWTLVLVIPASLAYQNAIVLPREEDDATQLTGLSGLLVACTALLTLVAVALFGEPFLAAFDATRLGVWLWALPLAVLLQGQIAVLRFWHIRAKAFRVVATGTLLTSLVTVSVRLFWGLEVDNQVGGLVLSLILAGVVTLAYMAWRSRRGRHKLVLRTLSRAGLTTNARRYAEFPRFMVWNQFLNTLSQESAILLLGFFYTPAVVGLYHLGKRILLQPSAMVSRSVAQVYLQQSAEKAAHGRALYGDLRRLTATLAALGAVPFGLVGVLGPHFFGFVFGADWTEAGRYVQLLSPWLFVGFINQPANMVYTVVKRLRLKFWLNLTLTVSRALAISVGYLLTRDPLWSIALFSAVSVVFNILYVVYAFRFAREHDAALDAR